MYTPPENAPESQSVDIQDQSTHATKEEDRVLKAVAIAYDGDTHSAPHVTATGTGTIAEQILSLAFAHGVRVRKDTALAEILSALDVDSPIPVEAFVAVAEILNYVYQMNAHHHHMKSSG